MIKRFYEILMQFTNATMPCRKHLLRRYSADLIDEAIDLELIVQVRRNEFGDPVYTITDKGKKLRDE